MLKAKKPQREQLTVGSSWDLPFSYGLLLRFDAGVIGNLRVAARLRSIGFRLTTQTF